MMGGRRAFFEVLLSSANPTSLSYEIGGFDEITKIHTLISIFWEKQPCRAGSQGLCVGV